MTGKQRAQKRTKKTRSSLAAQLGEGAGERAARIKLGVAGLPAVRSKSAQRRQKQREREQLAGNQAGLRDLHDAVDQVESDHMQAPRAPLPSTLTKKVQRAVLARERQRQPVRSHSRHYGHTREIP
ncbi:hypothetical protein MVES1_003946 [Malassezia vespertilionis]|uniref:uncharacterized protein n=1 Tax=Malassezia vespertilionis TaxID=2020962 RepID=UPI0024B0DF22|nr:uncharacterized protein MVES1_003946 [Malassezia vespertilionis]WFD08570.1 hypothetical protein MVES1_003946 [Malassezia vespertilionis]